MILEGVFAVVITFLFMRQVNRVLKWLGDRAVECESLMQFFFNLF